MSGKPTTWSECRWVMKCAVMEPIGIFFWNSRIEDPRPKSKISRSPPASTRVEALNADSRGVGVPVPSSVTLISAAVARCAPSNITLSAHNSAPNLRIDDFLRALQVRVRTSLGEAPGDANVEGGRWAPIDSLEKHLQVVGKIPSLK